MKEIKYQQKYVRQLVDMTIDLLRLSGHRKTLIFKAHTGSGKTVMASQMLADLHLGIQRKVSPDNLLHVELAHLYVVLCKGLEECLLTVYDQAANAVATLPDAAYGVLVLFYCLALHESHIQRPSRGGIQRQQHTEVAPPKGHIQMDKTFTNQRRMHPFALDVMQPALDCRNTYLETLRQLPDGLLPVLIGCPQVVLAHIRTGTELVAAVTAFVQLYALAYTVLYCM